MKKIIVRLQNARKVGEVRMTLEAGKEMDKRCVLNWLTEVYVTPSRAFNEYTEDELKMFAHDAIVLLKEQEAVKPKKADNSEESEYSCGSCEYPLWLDELYCAHCGRRIEWEGR